MTTNHATGAPASGARPRSGRWPLWLLAAPAAVSIWAGWVGLGQMCGYGLVHPLPGIAEGWSLNTAITLPIGMEAYSAYALGAWLSPRPLRHQARRFARTSALAALGLGLIGQIAYHLLISWGYHSAPVAVVVFVACLPVLVLGAGATLHHLLATHNEPTSATTEPPVTEPAMTEPVVIEPDTVGHSDGACSPAPAVRGSSSRTRRRRPVPRRLFADYLAEAQAKLAAAPAGTDPSPSWCRQATGCSKGTSSELAKALRRDTTPTPTTAATTEFEERKAA